MRDAEYNHPKLVEIYDAEGAWGPDDAYFLRLVNETPAARVLDLGCGTGRLALALAASGHVVTGIDPAAASLAAARAKAGSDRITWRQGLADAAPEAAFDIALMTGHVAQFLAGDGEWIRSLGALRRALVPNGRLAFHAYDPASRVWERWNPRDSHRQVVVPDGTRVSIWTEVTSCRGDIVGFSHHYLFADGAELRSDTTLRFWDEAALRQSVIDAGFTIDRVHGGWRGQPPGAGDGELIIVAKRTPD